MAKKTAKKAAPAKKAKPAKKGTAAKRKRPVTVQVSLDYRFTKDEIEDHSAQLASEIQAKNQLEDELKEAKSNFKAKIDAAQSNINKLATWVNTGHDYRSVPVVVKKNFDKGVKEYFHPDFPKRKLGEDKMVAADYQLEIWQKDGDGKTKSRRKPKLEVVSKDDKKEEDKK